VAVGAVALWACVIETADDSNRIALIIRIESKRGESIIALSSNASSISAGSIQAAISGQAARASTTKDKNINPC
jgi:hypothetical protein